MGNLGPITFDWGNGRVGVGKAWVAARSLLIGATPLARAMVVKQDEGEVKITQEQKGNQPHFRRFMKGRKVRTKRTPIRIQQNVCE